MGSCIGRCFCEIGKCCCFDCVVLKSGVSNAIPRKHRSNKSQTFTLRRQSSSPTIEFENLMFDFDLPDNSNTMIQMHPTSVSSWIALKENEAKGLSGQSLRMNANAIAIDRHSALSALKMRNNDYDRDIDYIDYDYDIGNGNDNGIAIGSRSGGTTCRQDNQNTTRLVAPELPLIESLLIRSTLLKRKRGSPDNRERISIGGASSVGELQWENEILSDEFNGNEQNGNENGNELEWDHYQENSLSFQHETDQLIHDINHLTLNQMRS